ncbi:hypothetical protein ABT247_16655, partial [Kitasatospora sp. NPDC001539]
MSRKLPEELVPLLARTGRSWPQADEEALRKAAALWREFGAEADRLARRCGESVQRVTSENSGHAVESFGAYWRTYSGGGKGHLDDAHTAVGLVGTAFDTAARAVDGCKAEIVATLQNLAAELRQAEDQAAAVRRTAASVAAAARTEAGPERTGVFGGLRKAVTGVADGVANTNTAQLAAGVEEAAVEAAGLKIAGLLAELGRSMKDALSTALQDPAAVALLRLGTAAGTGVTSASRRTGGGFDPRAAGLPAALGEPGVLAADGTGLVLLAGQDGRPVIGVPGLGVRLDAHGQPVLGPDGRPVILRSDGTPVTDAAGLLVVTGPDGKPVVGVADLAVQRDGQGRPVLTDETGTEVRGLALADLTDPRDLGELTGPTGLPDPAAAPDAKGDPDRSDRKAGSAGPDAVTVPAAVPGVVETAAGTPAPSSVVPGPAEPAVDPLGAAAPATGPAFPPPHRHPAAPAPGDWSPPGRDDGPAVRGDSAPPHRGGAAAPGWSDEDYPLQAPAHNGGGGGALTESV